MHRLFAMSEGKLKEKLLDIAEKLQDKTRKLTFCIAGGSDDRLMRFLKSVPEAAPLVIIDQSRIESSSTLRKRLLSSVAENQNWSVLYLEDRLELVSRLAANGLPRKALTSLLGEFAWQQTNVGQARNLALSITGSETAVLSDDDIAWFGARTHGITLDPAGQLGKSQWQFQACANLDEALSELEFEAIDFSRLYSQAFGDNPAVDFVRPSIAGGTTLNSCAKKIFSPAWLEGGLIDRFEDLADTRIARRIVNNAAIASMGGHTGTQYGINCARGSVPEFAAFKSQDSIWALQMEKFLGNATELHLPLAIFHPPRGGVHRNSILRDIGTFQLEVADIIRSLLATSLHDQNSGSGCAGQASGLRAMLGPRRDASDFRELVAQRLRETYIALKRNTGFLRDRFAQSSEVSGRLFESLEFFSNRVDRLVSEIESGAKIEFSDFELSQRDHCEHLHEQLHAHADALEIWDEVVARVSNVDL